MKKLFYLQLDNENRVTDILTYPFNDYRGVQLDTPLPINSYSGVYQLINNKLVLNEIWKEESVAEQIASVKTNLELNT